MVKTARTIAYGVAVSANVNRHFRSGPIHVRCRWFMKDRRRRDADNLLGSMKAAFDGIADALGFDDSGFVHWPCTIGYDRERPRVEVDLWDSEGQGVEPCRPYPSSDRPRP
jgi:Holliday junction resolvase RusA-like endonuclease